MKCKYCDYELVEGMNDCPGCGKAQVETAAEETAEELVVETPAEEIAVESPVGEVASEVQEGIKASPKKIVLSVVAGILVLAMLVAMILSGVDGDLFKGEEIVPSEEAVSGIEEETVPAGTIPPDGNPEDVTCKGSYTVSDAEIEDSMDTVVAVIEDKELTLGQLQVYYWECVYAFDGQWGSNAALLGLDLRYPLDTQLCETGDVSMTWQQYFLDYALNTWHQHQSMALEAAENGYVLDAAYQEEIDGLNAQLEEVAVYYGFDNVEELIRDYIGPGCTAADYNDYMRTYYEGYGYLDHLAANLEIADEDVDAFFAEHEAGYAEMGITKDAGSVIDVRHILLMPENGTTGADGYPTYSDEDWAACEAEVQKIYDEWLAGDLSEDSFAEFAKKYSQDGNAAQGGIYEDVAQGYMVETFDAWCFDENRQFGDHGIVKTQYGYHIMFFVDSDEIWYTTTKEDMIAEQMDAKIPAAMEKFPMTVDYGSIKLGFVDFSNG